jgi:catecholate siderophore receptor
LIIRSEQLENKEFMMNVHNRSIVRPVSLRQAGAAMALSAAMLGTPAMAQQTAGSQDQEVELDTLKIEDKTADVNPYAEKGAPYKARISGDARHTRPIAETPQTISVLTQTQIQDSGYTDLARILDAQPGITVGTGENGNAFGDRYIIRGQEAKSDVFVDGLRDPGMTIRESFAVEQIEISKGPNSSFAGRGTSGGAINAITKMATTDYDFGKASVGLGNDRYVRATGDVNMVVNDKIALRGNILYAYQEVPDRKPADRERKGFAASALFQPSETLNLIVDYYGLRAKDNPDLGGYLITNAVTGNREPAAGVPSYAQAEDFLKSKVDTFTGRIKYEFSPTIWLTNITRYGLSDNSYVTTGASGRTTSTSNPTGVYATSVLDNGHTGWQDVRYFANQANLYITSDLLGGKNELIFGAEYTKHKVDSGNYTRTSQAAFNCMTGTSTTLNSFCITDANGAPVANLNNLAQRVWVRSPFATRKWQVETLSATVMDTIDLTPALTLFAGGRFDHFTYKLDTFNGTTGVTTIASGQPYRYSDTLWNGHVGLSYKVGDAMFYASAATAADINGGESDTGTSSGYGGLVLYQGDVAGAKPERSLNLEIGSKLNLFDNRLLLTASLFQSTKKDVMEGADYDVVGTFNTGKNRVRGFELGVAGNVTDQWSLQGGVTLMQSKVLRSANIGISGAQLALGATNVGKPLANFAKFQAEFQTRYQFTEKYAMGVAIKHKGRRYGGQPDTGALFTQSATGYTFNQPVPAYTVGDMFFEYKFNNRMDLRVNINNITNEDYYTAVYRSGSFLYKGDARTMVGTFSVKF